MLTAIVALKRTKNISEFKGDYIGVDAGALALMKAHLPITLAIGDFDSMTSQELKELKEYAKEVIQLNPIKDDSDSEAAFQTLFERGYEQLIVLGALGGRIDHEIVNLRLAYKYPQQVILMDDCNKIQAFKKGEYSFQKDGYSYISFFTQTSATITLKNFKYPLDQRTITEQDLYTVSNEVVDEGTLIVHSGCVLVLQTKDE